MNYTQTCIAKPIQVTDKLQGLVADMTPNDSTLEIYSLEWIWPVNIRQEDISPIPENVIRRRLTDALYGKEELDKDIQELSSGAPSIERIWQITEKLPPLHDILLEERNNE